MHTVRRLFLMALIALLVAASFPALRGNTAHAQTKKVFTIGAAENSTSLDPARGFEQQTSILHKATYETLVTFPADNVEKIVPGLASEWKISADGLIYTFTLREGVKFVSGNVLTAEDVVFSFNRLKNVKGNPSSLAGTIDTVTATDAKTVTIKLNAIDAAFLAKLIFGAFSIVDSKTVKAQGGTDAVGADTTDKAEAYLNANSAGTGPYVLTKWEKANEVVLSKNPNYNGSMTAAFDEIIMKDMPKAATQKAALEAGDVDLALDLSADQIPSLETLGDVSIYTGTAPTVFFVLMNANKSVGGPMSNLKVQKAVRLALDYAGIKKLAGGSAATPGSIIPLGFAGAYTTEQAMKTNLEEAKKLLAESGEKDIVVDISYPDFTYQGINIGTMAQKVQADMKALGITVNLKGGEVQVALAGYRDGKDAFSLWFWGPDFIDALNYTEFLPDMKVGKRAGWTNENSSPEIQKLRDDVLKESDPAKRAALFAEIQKAWHESGPFAPIVQPGIQIAYRKDLKGFAYNPQWIINPASFSR